MGFIGGLLNFLLVLSSLFLICLVLIQRGRGGGLAGAFGGVGGSSAFGTKAGDVFTRVTIVVAAVWFLLAIIQVVLNNQGRESAFATDGDRSRTLPITSGDTGTGTGTGTATPPPATGTGAATPSAATTPAPASTDTPAAPASAKTDSTLPDVFEDNEKAAPAPAPTPAPAPAPTPEPAKAP